MKKVIAALSVALVPLVALAVEMGHKEVRVEQSQVQWVQPYGPKGPGFGVVEGAFGKLGTPGSLFVKLPAGSDSGWHIHSDDYRAVVISGTFIEQQKGDAKETLLPVGTYWTQPAKVPHRNACTKEADCLIFAHFDNGIDSMATTQDGKPVQPMKPAGGMSNKM